MKRPLRLLSRFLLFAAGLTLTHAGGTVELSAQSPRGDARVPATLRIARVEAEVTMRGVLAETKATLTLAIDTEDASRKMEGRLTFPLPPDCIITGAALDIGQTMRPASVTFRETAVRAYQAVVSRMLDPCLVQLLPDGRVSAQVFPFQDGNPRMLRLEFAQTLPPGTVWRFPLTFAAPVPEAVLKADAPGVLGLERRSNFTGDWSLTAPPETKAGHLTAHPDAAGRWLFQAALPPAPLAEPPHHLLLLADVSLLQAPRDAAAEKAFLQRIFYRMQTGRVTLVTFSSALHGRQEFAVQDGKCEALSAALAAIEFDGAPRPGAVDVSDIPADLTVILSTLHAPMGGGLTPRLPALAPVWVLDSVSKTPSAAARLLAAETGGEVLDPRRILEIAFRRRPALSSPNLTALRFHPLSEAGFLLTGELTGESADLTIGGKIRRIVKSTDAAAGLLIAHEHERANFLRLAEENRTLLQANLRSDKNIAPFLSETTALIVLEQLHDYQRFGIPLPPDLANAGARETSENREDHAGRFIYDRALRRPAGTVGDPAEWHSRVRARDNRQELDAANENKRRFRQYREQFGALPRRLDWLEKEEYYRSAVAQSEGAVKELSRLSLAYQNAPESTREKLIRQGRGEQQKIMQRIELLAGIPEEGMMLYTGGAPGADPFAGPPGFSDSFAGPDAASGSGTGAGGGVGSGAPQPVEPLALPPPDPVASAPAPEPAASSFPITPATPSRGRYDPPQIPQTFGGGGVGLLGAGSSFPVTPTTPGTPSAADEEPFLPPRQKPAAAEPPPHSLRTVDILARATRLHTARRHAESVRSLSALALPGPDEHARLRLLAWLLQEWGEPVLALEVLSEAAARFGETDTTLRDRGLATLAAGRKEEGLTLLRRVDHHVTWRDVAGLEARMDAALRVVVECASEQGDVNLEVQGPEYELCSWRNPLPSFGGALSFDSRGEAPGDFVLPVLPAHPVQVRFRLQSTAPQPVRITVIENWGRPAETRRTILLPQCPPGRNEVVQFPAGPK